MKNNEQYTHNTIPLTFLNKDGKMYDIIDFRKNLNPNSFLVDKIAQLNIMRPHRRQ